MNYIKKLRKQADYVYCRHYTDRELRSASERGFVITVASLTVGYLRLDAVCFPRNGQLELSYDFLVRDSPDGTDWLCYDSPEEPVRLREQTMAEVLERTRAKHGLSYTQWNFPEVQEKDARKLGNL